MCLQNVFLENLNYTGFAVCSVLIRNLFTGKGGFMLNFAVLGTNELSELYTEAIAAAGERFYAVCSRDLARAEAFARGRALVFDDLNRLLADPAVDAVYICLPNSLHAKTAMRCLKAGKHVLCEKPITVTASELEALCKAADESGTVLAEAVMNFYSPLMPRLREQLTNEKIVSARLDYSQRSSNLDSARAGKPASSLSRPLCGGALYDLGVYPLHFAVNLLGEPERVFTSASWLGDVDVTDTLILGYPDFDISVTVSKAGEGDVGSEIICDSATYTFSNVSIVLGAEKVTLEGRKPLYCGPHLSGVSKLSTPVFRDVQPRIIERFSQWVRGADTEGCLALRRESLAVQKIMEEAHSQIGYYI